MSKLILPITIVLLTLSACSEDPEKTTESPPPANNLTEEEVMIVIHCAEMQMPECDAYKDVTLSEAQIKQGCEVMPEMTICETQ